MAFILVLILDMLYFVQVLKEDKIKTLVAKGSEPAVGHGKAVISQPPSQDDEEVQEDGLASEGLSGCMPNSYNYMFSIM